MMLSLMVSPLRSLDDPPRSGSPGRDQLVRPSAARTKASCNPSTTMSRGLNVPVSSGHTGKLTFASRSRRKSPPPAQSACAIRTPRTAIVGVKPNPSVRVIVAIVTGRPKRLLSRSATTLLSIPNGKAAMTSSAVSGTTAAMVSRRKRLPGLTPIVRPEPEGILTCIMDAHQADMVPKWSEVDRDTLQLPIAIARRIEPKRVRLRGCLRLRLRHRRVAAQIGGRLHMVGTLAHRSSPV
jgi:hypothetical protein